MKLKHENHSTTTILTRIDRKLIVTNPIYQRGYVWNSNFKSKFILSMLSSFPIGIIILHEKELDRNNYIYDVVDGQQRLKTIDDFKNNNFELQSKESREIFKIFRLDFEKELILKCKSDKLWCKKISNMIKKYDEGKDNINLKFNDLTDNLRYLLLDYQIPFTYIMDIEEQDIKRFFKNVQNQEKLLAGEIIKSLPNNWFAEIASFLEEKEDNGKTIIENVFGFKNNRNEIHKILINVYGIVEGTLKLGCADKKIMNFLDKNDNCQLDERIYERIERIKKFVIYLQSLNASFRLNKQSLKILFLLLLSDEDTFNSLMKYTKKEFLIIDIMFNNLKIFKSKDKQQNIINYFGNFDNPQIKLYEELSSLTSSLHDWNPTIKRILPNILDIVKIEIKNQEIQEKESFSRYIGDTQKGLILKNQNHKCGYCGDSITLSDVEFDHVLPYSKGGKTEKENIIASCFKCNREKGNKINV